MLESTPRSSLQHVCMYTAGAKKGHTMHVGYVCDLKFQGQPLRSRNIFQHF